MPRLGDGFPARESLKSEFDRVPKLWYTFSSCLGGTRGRTERSVDRTAWRQKASQTRARKFVGNSVKSRFDKILKLWYTSSSCLRHNAGPDGSGTSGDEPLGGNLKELKRSKLALDKAF
jgi:hypothetical protein